ncbi:GNAT family N-acetyltransferase [Lewinella cohaerens]|uniref:GNAT family N-acetyltransferase n=1 Tax=Lewinella cohaerens TaxID=70995 RepID=UPI00035F9472|nr:GNAT family N-acetyltransferase [Lewinella cohaerens]
MKFQPTTQEEVSTYRQELYRTFVAPLDGMWEALYVASATPFLITLEDTSIGYCCIDEDKNINQLYLMPVHRFLINKVVEELIKEAMIQGALLSSIEPVAFNVCLAKTNTISANTFNFHYASPQKGENKKQLDLIKARMDDHSAIKSFFLNEAGFDDNFGYAENLIKRGEIFLLIEDGILTATGECRLSDTQPAYADVGMIVKQDARKRGWGGKVLATLAGIAERQGRIPICSTTVDNIASQKAIQKAGFYQSHIVFKMEF